MRILLQSHPESLRVMARAVLWAAMSVLGFQIATTGLFLANQGEPTKWTTLFCAGCVLGFVISALEYVGIEALRNQWKNMNFDGQITFGECLLLAGIVALFSAVIFLDAKATAMGAMVLGFNTTVSWTWAVGQLFAFEVLFSMHFHLRDQAG